MNSMARKYNFSPLDNEIFFHEKDFIMAAWQPGATSEHTRGTRFEHTCVAAFTAIARSLDLLKIISKRAARCRANNFTRD